MPEISYVCASALRGDRSILESKQGTLLRAPTTAALSHRAESRPEKQRRPGLRRLAWPR